MKIEPLVHSCIIETGDMAGNDHEHVVTEYDVLFEANCDVCGERLATIDRVVLHMYGQLTGG